ncbi:MAG: hypothetical protein WEC72_03190 [Chthoniobacterales bacterium]
MRRALVTIVAVALIFAGSGCALFGPKEPEIPEATLPAWIGRVVMVDATHRFVLVDTGAGASLGAGTAVMTLRDKRRTGLLRITDEVRPPYVAMEILEGAPALGDQAVIDEGRPEPPEPPAPPTE